MLLPFRVRDPGGSRHFWWVPVQLGVVIRQGHCIHSQFHAMTIAGVAFLPCSRRSDQTPDQRERERVVYSRLPWFVGRRANNILSRMDHGTVCNYCETMVAKFREWPICENAWHAANALSH